MAKENKTKEKILKSAEKLFAERGYDAVSIDDIAKEAETTKSLFFYYFEKKPDILHTLMRNKIKEAVEKFSAKIVSGEIPPKKEEVYIYAENFIKDNLAISRIALFELLKTNSGTNFIMDLPHEIFSKFPHIFELTDEDEIKFIVLTVKTVILSSLCDNLCQKFDVEKSFVENLYNEI